MKPFRGFEETDASTSIPDAFFRDLLGHMDDIAEMKVVLHALWSSQHEEGGLRGLSPEDMLAANLGLSRQQTVEALAKAVGHGILLRAGGEGARRFFLNSPHGRGAAEALSAGRPDAGREGSLGPTDRTNVYHLYEENIGPLTPLIADALTDAEQIYPPEWISEAIELAVRNNKRSWSYCEAILKRWKEEGRAKKQIRRDDQAARQRDIEEKIRKFIRG